MNENDLGYISNNSLYITTLEHKRERDTRLNSKVILGSQVLIVNHKPLINKKL